VVQPGASTLQDLTLMSDSDQPVFSDGFESGSLAGWTSSRSLAITGARVHGGAFAAEATSTSGGFARKNLASTYSAGYARVWFEIVSGSSLINVFRLNNASGVPIAYLYVTQPGLLGMATPKTKMVSSTSVSTGNFHEIELALTINGPSSTTKVWIDGKPVSELSRTIDLGTSPIAQLQIGQAQSGGTYDVAFDDAWFDIPLQP
jgi:hypothetical protein